MAADTSGTVTFYEAGEAQVGVVVRGKAGFTKVTIKPARAVGLDVAPPDARIVVRGTVKLAVTPRAANGNPRGVVNERWMADGKSSKEQ